MQIKKLTDAVSVSPQIVPADIGDLVAAGFKSIICNRPDGQGADQPLFREIEEEAERLGLATTYIPVTGGKVGDESAARFGQALATLPGPVLAYCRSGTRSTMLWSRSAAGHAEGPRVDG